METGVLTAKYQLTYSGRPAGPPRREYFTACQDAVAQNVGYWAAPEGWAKIVLDDGYEIRKL
jgi:hypothetical protein